MRTFADRLPVESCEHRDLGDPYDWPGEPALGPQVHCHDCKGDFSLRTLQQKHLERVQSKIGRAILEWCAAMVGRRWRMQELVGAVESRGIPVAPDSPGRILRNLKQQGLVKYRVTNRRQSEYLVEAVTL